MDYNEQALYSGVYAVNHVELAQPYYDFVSAQVGGGGWGSDRPGPDILPCSLCAQLAGGGPQAESAALGCPGGAHFSVDLVFWCGCVALAGDGLAVHESLNPPLTPRHSSRRGLKLGIKDAPMAWGIRTNAIYTAQVGRGGSAAPCRSVLQPPLVAELHLPLGDHAARPGVGLRVRVAVVRARRRLLALLPRQYDTPRRVRGS